MDHWHSSSFDLAHIDDHVHTVLLADLQTRASRGDGVGLNFTDIFFSFRGSGTLQDIAETQDHSGELGVRVRKVFLLPDLLNLPTFLLLIHSKFFRAT